MTIPFLSLKEQTAALKPEVMKALEAVVDSQGFANRQPAQFEKELASFLGCKEVVCVNSGTTSLHGALICAGVGAGDDVLTVAHTWISTVWAISYANAHPCSSTSIRPRVAWTRATSRRSSRPRPRQSCQSTSTACRSTSTRSSTSPRRRACRSSRTARSPSARRTRASRRAASASSTPRASTPQDLGPGARAARA